MFKFLRSDPRLKASTPHQTRPLRCQACQRLVSDWVAELGFTISSDHSCYCRFCYVALRQCGKLQSRADDSEFMNGINWELTLLNEVNQQRGIGKNAAPRQTRMNIPGCTRTTRFAPKKMIKAG